MFLVVVPFRSYPPYIKVKIIMYLSSICSTSPDESRYVTLSWKLIFSAGKLSDVLYYVLPSQNLLSKMKQPAVFIADGPVVKVQLQR